jgi:hypothetical protein
VGPGLSAPATPGLKTPRYINRNALVTPLAW